MSLKPGSRLILSSMIPQRYHRFHRWFLLIQESRLLLLLIVLTTISWNLRLLILMKAAAYSSWQQKALPSTQLWILESTPRYYLSPIYFVSAASLYTMGCSQFQRGRWWTHLNSPPAFLCWTGRCLLRCRQKYELDVVFACWHAFVSDLSSLTPSFSQQSRSPYVRAYPILGWCHAYPFLESSILVRMPRCSSWQRCWSNSADHYFLLPLLFQRNCWLVLAPS